MLLALEVVQVQLVEIVHLIAQLLALEEVLDRVAVMRVAQF